LLVVEGVVAVFIGVNYFNLGWKALQTFMMLLLVFSSQVRVLIVRERGHFWASRPRRELLFSTVGTTAGFLILGVYGIIIPPLTPYLTFFILGFSVLSVLGLDFPKFYIFRRFGL
jgi:H+-transporting ATPase